LNTEFDLPGRKIKTVLYPHPCAHVALNSSKKSF